MLCSFHCTVLVIFLSFFPSFFMTSMAVFCTTKGCLHIQYLLQRDQWVYLIIRFVIAWSVVDPEPTPPCARRPLCDTRSAHHAACWHLTVVLNRVLNIASSYWNYDSGWKYIIIIVCYVQFLRGDLTTFMLKMVFNCMIFQLYIDKVDVIVHFVDFSLFGTELLMTIVYLPPVFSGHCKCINSFCVDMSVVVWGCWCGEWTEYAFMKNLLDIKWLGYQIQHPDHCKTWLGLYFKHPHSPSAALYVTV